MNAISKATKKSFNRFLETRGTRGQECGEGGGCHRPCGDPRPVAVALLAGAPGAHDLVPVQVLRQVVLVHVLLLNAVLLLVRLGKLGQLDGVRGEAVSDAGDQAVGPGRVLVVDGAAVDGVEVLVALCCALIYVSLRRNPLLFFA